MMRADSAHVDVAIVDVISNQRVKIPLYTLIDIISIE
jgi:hypothetical protein